MDNLQNILSLIFIVGGGGAITVLVTAYRRLKTGKIGDEESIIKILHRQLTTADRRADTAERERDREVRLKEYWREEAALYRVQLIEEGIIPREPKAMPTDE